MLDFGITGPLYINQRQPQLPELNKTSDNHYIYQTKNTIDESYSVLWLILRPDTHIW